MQVKYAVITARFCFNPAKCKSIEEAFKKFDGDENGEQVALFDTIEEAREYLSSIEVTTHKYSWNLAEAYVAFINEAEYDYDKDLQEWQFIGGGNYWDLKAEELQDNSDDE